MADFKNGDEADPVKLKKIKALIEKALDISTDRPPGLAQKKARREVETRLRVMTIGRKGDLPATLSRSFWSKLNELADLVKDYDDLAGENAAEGNTKKRKTIDDAEAQGPKRGRKAPSVTSGTVNGKALYFGERKELGALDRAAVWRNGFRTQGAPKDSRACAVWRNNPDCAVNVTMAPKQWHADHIEAWSKRTYKVDYVIFCHEGFHYEAHLFEDAKAAYQDVDNLQILCVSCNEKKGGDKGKDLDKPTSINTCDDPAKCKYPKLKL